MPFRPIYTKTDERIKILIKGPNKQKTEEQHSTLIPLQYQIPYNFAIVLKSMYIFYVYSLINLFIKLIFQRKAQYIFYVYSLINLFIKLIFQRKAQVC